MVTLPEYDLLGIYPHKRVLSSSQVLLYLKDPQAFYTTYQLGVAKDETVPMLVGRIFSALYADRKYPVREALTQIGAPRHLADRFETVIKRLPVTEAEVPFHVEHNGWGFRITLDGYEGKVYTIVENKTGQTAWTQERTNTDLQLTMQGWAHKKLKDVPPRRIILNYVDTRPSAKTILQSFNTSRSTKAIANFEKLVEMAIEGIEAGNWTKPIL